MLSIVGASVVGVLVVSVVVDSEWVLRDLSRVNTHPARNWSVLVSRQKGSLIRSPIMVREARK